MEQISSAIQSSIRNTKHRQLFRLDSLSYIQLEQVNFSNRSVPVGVDDTIDITTHNLLCQFTLLHLQKLRNWVLLTR